MTIDLDIKLKPCPKCGSTSVKQFEYDDGYSVFCRRCQFELYPHKLEKFAAEEWNALPRHLQWTTETPTEPGYYWVRLGRLPGSQKIAQFYLDCGVWRATTFNGDRALAHYFYEDAFDEWAGPIPYPQEKK